VLCGGMWQQDGGLWIMKSVDKCYRHKLRCRLCVGVFYLHERRGRAILKVFLKKG